MYLMNFALRQNLGTISEIWNGLWKANFQNDAVSSLYDWLEFATIRLDLRDKLAFIWKPDQGLTVIVIRSYVALNSSNYWVVPNCILDDEAMMTSSESECIFSWTDIVRWITRIRIWPVIIAVTWEVEFWFWIRMFIIIQTAKFCFRTQFWNVEFLAF